MNAPSYSSTPLWLADPVTEFPPLAGEVDADVAVIGGGMSGVCLAYALAEQGGSVAVVDAGPLAGGASGRNAGFLMCAPAEPYPEQVAMWGRVGARAVMELGRRSHERIRQLSESLGIECGYRASGSLRLARSAEEADDFRESLPLLRADGFPMEEVPVAEVVPATAARGFTAAFITSEDGEFHPVRFLRGLASAAAARGARFFERSAVDSASWRGGLWEARTASGLVRARTLVIANNAYASRLCPALEELIRPRRGQMLATAPLEREITSRPATARYGYQYWRQTPERRLVIGGWRDLDLDGETGFDERISEPIQQGIESGLLELVPEGAPIEHRWAGTMGFARDGRALVGWLDAAHHLAICAGFTGHGLGLAAACTLDLTEVLSFRSANGITSLDPLRFPELRQDRENIVALGSVSG